MSNHDESLFAAVSMLVTHGPIKQRLIRAYEDHLEALHEDELPAEVQESFATLRSMMHCVAPANGEGPICASVRKMSKSQADDCASLIVQIYGEISRHSSTSPATVSPIVRQVSEGTAVPQFLAKSL